MGPHGNDNFEYYEEAAEHLHKHTPGSSCVLGDNV